jgi:hypothetical protein
MANKTVAIQANATEAQPSIKKHPRAKTKAARKRVTKKRSNKKRSAKRKSPKKQSAKSITSRMPAKRTAAKMSAPKKRPTKKRKSKKQPVPITINKAQAIRDAAKDIGGKPRPKDIIAALAAKDISVSSPQVSMTLKAVGLRKGRRQRKVLVQVASKPRSSHGQMFNINDLLQVKILAKELGGTAMLRELAEALERLV